MTKWKMIIFHTYIVHFKTYFNLFIIIRIKVTKFLLFLHLQLLSQFIFHNQNFPNGKWKQNKRHVVVWRRNLAVAPKLTLPPRNLKYVYSIIIIIIILILLSLTIYIHKSKLLFSFLAWRKKWYVKKLKLQLKVILISPKKE